MRYNEIIEDETGSRVMYELLPMEEYSYNISQLRLEFARKYHTINHPILPPEEYKANLDRLVKDYKSNEYMILYLIAN
jgi:hypothetical protein